jgi:hypothetical protein
MLLNPVAAAEHFRAQRWLADCALLCQVFSGDGPQMSEAPENGFVALLHV